MISEAASEALKACDYAKAIPLLESEALDGDVDAQFKLAELLAYTQTAKASEVEAIRWFRASMAQGHPDARYRLAMLLVTGQTTGANEKEEGLRLLSACAEAGNHQAQSFLGQRLIDQGNTQDGIHWLEKAAEAAQDTFAAGEAAVTLGQLYFEGDGVERDIIRAIEWFEVAHKYGHDQFASDIARLYDEGDGLERDLSAAAKWYRRAADMNYEGAKYRLGQMYLKGEGVTADRKEAARIFCNGAEADPNCMNALVSLLKEGVDLDPSECEFITWYRKAIDEDDRDLQLYLGLKNNLFTKSFIAAITGFAALVALLILDTILIANNVGAEYGKVSWFPIVLLALAGFYLSGWMNQFEYQEHRYSRIMGFPFPTVIFEPYELGSDAWIDFTGPITLISSAMNALLLVALLIAICLLLPQDMVKFYVIVVLIISGKKAGQSQRSAKSTEGSEAP